MAMKPLFILLPLHMYILTLALYYYIYLIGKTPKISNNIPVQTRSLCIVCNIFCSPLTFHCDTCNKCYYKRDHHCPWIGKCVAADNYREFYFFVMFLDIFLGMRMMNSNYCFNVGFLGGYMLVCVSGLFLWMNFLICVDQTGSEYRKYGGKFRPWLFIKKWKECLLNGYVNNILYVGFPFLQKTAKVVK